MLVYLVLRAGLYISDKSCFFPIGSLSKSKLLRPVFFLQLLLHQKPVFLANLMIPGVFAEKKRNKLSKTLQKS